MARSRRTATGLIRAADVSAIAPARSIAAPGTTPRVPRRTADPAPVSGNVSTAARPMSHAGPAHGGPAVSSLPLRAEVGGNTSAGTSSGGPNL